MSSMVSRRPSSRNHLNEDFWISIRLGRSSTCSRRENDLRARGDATLVVKEKASLGGRAKSGGSRHAGMRGRAERRRNPSGYRNRPLYRKQRPAAVAGMPPKGSAPSRIRLETPFGLRRGGARM